jgi:vacuolar-type H+-ATPase subunit C/Vma6
MVQAQQALTIERLLVDLAELQQRALALLAEAEQVGDLRAALAAIREVRGVIETGARLIEASELRKRVEDLERIVSERGVR